MEIWRNINTHIGLYEISNYGRVKSLNYNHTQKDKILKKRIDKDGYYNIVLCNGGKNRYARICRLVAQAFISNPENKPQVNHIDGDKQNDNWYNLEWVTSSENNKHAFKIGLKTQIGEKNNQAKLKNKDIIFIRKNKNKYKQMELAKLFNVSQRNIRFIIKNKTWKHINANSTFGKVPTL